MFVHRALNFVYAVFRVEINIMSFHRFQPGGGNKFSSLSKQNGKYFLVAPLIR